MTWTLLTRLGWKREQCPYRSGVERQGQLHVLEVVREWSILLLAWLCVGLYEWCGRQVEPSTHTLLATQPPIRSKGPLLRSRLTQNKNIRGARRTWREMVGCSLMCTTQEKKAAEGQEERHELESSGQPDSEGTPPADVLMEQAEVDEQVAPLEAVLQAVQAALEGEPASPAKRARI